MSYLIDSFKDASCEIKGRWWISKPLLNPSIQTTVKWIIEILRGKAIAVHFKEDETREEKPWSSAALTTATGPHSTERK